MAVRDPQTEWLRVLHYRRMTPERRIEIAAQMFDDGVSIVRDSILDRHPDISPEELRREIRRRVLGRRLADVGADEGIDEDPDGYYTTVMNGRYE